ncbi:MAG TPA: Fe-S cluster assembly protein SufD [Mycobacteriales bacterium]|nr:Fe-S cluster assembly protein SufD [Mycobacteriales bacterium]
MASTTAAPRVDARTLRIASANPEDFPIPTGREEEWRFTPFRRLNGLHSADPRSRPDGKLSVVADHPPDVEVRVIERDDPRVGSVFIPNDRVAALAFAGFTAGTSVTVPRGVVTDRPVIVTTTAEGGTAYGHLLIDVEPQAAAVVVLDHRGSGTVAANVEIRVGDGASLRLVSLQDWADDTVHLGQHVAEVGRDARFDAVHVTLGGDLVRLAPTVRFTGPGGEADLAGLYFADAGQHLEHRLFIDHAQPNCRSRVTYKGALAGKRAHTVWIGDVLIRPTGVGTDTFELNRNLVLTDGARADSVPNLEIETGEVARAGHASATGRFDDEQLFYLQSRGIAKEDARRLVVRAFFADVLAHIQVPEVAARVAAAVEAELERIPG